MATDAETIAAGFTLPQGSDMISDGDNAITTNAKATVDLINSGKWYRGTALPDMDYKTMAPGVWLVLGGATADPMGLPASRMGWLTIAPYGTRTMRHIKFTTNDVNDSASLEIYEIANDQNGSWTNSSWHKTYPASGAGSSAANSFRHGLLMNEQRAAMGGTIKTNGATPVAIVWDDYPNAMRDKVISLLDARGIKVSLALCSRTMTPERAPYLGGEGITWPEVDAWVANGHEPVNHGATHMDRITPEDIDDEVITGKAELQGHLPSGVVRCWVQPSAVYDAGFDNGNTAEAWANTYAGQTILGNHALATGTMTLLPDGSAPRDGNPVQGLNRTWIDTGTTQAQARISALAGTGRGIIIGAHANRVDMGTGYITTAELTTFLDWLISEQTAGRVKIMTLSQFAIADARPGNATMRVDTTVGTRVFITDGVTERLISGETGWRTLTSWGTDGVVSGDPLPAGLTPDVGKAGYVRIRRTIDDASLSIAGTNCTTSYPVFVLPTGFRPTTATSTFFATSNSTLRGAKVNQTNVFTTFLVGDKADTSYATRIEFNSLGAWPTSLPGAPA